MARKLALFFESECGSGNLHKARKILHNENTTILYFDSAFCAACEHGHLEVAKWLLEINPYNNEYSYDCAFRLACYYGRLNILKWLIDLIPYIDITTYDDDGFRTACHRGHLQTAKWLEKLRPDRYKIIRLDFSKPIIRKNIDEPCYPIICEVNNDEHSDYILK